VLLLGIPLQLSDYLECIGDKVLQQLGTHLRCIGDKALQQLSTELQLCSSAASATSLATIRRTIQNGKVQHNVQVGTAPVGSLSIMNQHEWPKVQHNYLATIKVSSKCVGMNGVVQQALA
jgi:hypothetical protein